MTDSEYFTGNKTASINAQFVDHTEIDLIQEELSAESQLIKNEQYQAMSSESKEVIEMVINTPSEILGIITTPSGMKSKKLIIKFLLSKWKSKFLVETIIDEITRLVKSF